jgi:hypothetical protein
MTDIEYETLRLDIQDYLTRISSRDPDRIEEIHESTDNEALIGKAVVSADSMLEVGQVAVPLVNSRFLQNIGARATAAFAETRVYGPPRRIWLPGPYYNRSDIPQIGVTYSGSLAEAWENLDEALYEPVTRRGYIRYCESLLKEARGIAKDLGVLTLQNIDRAVILFPTK